MRHYGYIVGRYGARGSPIKAHNGAPHLPPQRLIMGPQRPPLYYGYELWGNLSNLSAFFCIIRSRCICNYVGRACFKSLTGLGGSRWRVWGNCKCHNIISSFLCISNAMKFTRPLSTAASAFALHLFFMNSHLAPSSMKAKKQEEDGHSASASPKPSLSPPLPFLLSFPNFKVPPSGSGPSPSTPAAASITSTQRS